MRMKIKVLYKEYAGKYYFISPLTGNLCVSNHLVKNGLIPDLISKSLDYCEYPYSLNSINSIDKKSFSFLTTKNINKIQTFNNKLLWLGNRNFLLSTIYSSFQKPIFENTIDAFDYISQIDDHKSKFGYLCLQRALLAAKISKSFKKNGVIFIGATLPTYNMHAWIIEGDIQPDREDRIWIMYQPLLALYF